ncbi:MAG: crossover junction endodeoxyribonuclease RuvC [Balneolaceae bacterium]
MAQRIILGIDPGSRHTGFAILVEQDGKFSVEECEVIHTYKLEDHTARLQQIFEELSNILTKYNPDSCAVETPVYGIDPLAMLKLGRAQAAAILAITNRGIPVSEYYPKAVKKSITGNGNASKKQVAYMLEKMISIPSVSKLSEDATDALAVAWCHASKLNSPAGSSGKKQHQNNKKSSWSEFVADNPDRIRRGST